MAPDRPQALLSARIVVLDDDETNVTLLCGLLTSVGCVDVVGHQESAVALEHLARAPCELLLLDLHMPEIDGFEVLRRLGDWPVAPAVIVLSADVTAQARQRALAAGACAFITKPYDLLDVLHRAGRAVDPASRARSWGPPASTG